MSVQKQKEALGSTGKNSRNSTAKWDNSKKGQWKRSQQIHKVMREEETRGEHG